MSFLSIQNLRKEFQDRKIGKNVAVKSFSLEVERTEFVSLLGPSGCGKTTVLRMLAGFETPTSGEIRMDGQSVEHLPPHKRNCGMVFQNYALFPHMNVNENVGYGLKLRGVPREERDQKVRDILAQVGLENLEDRSPSELSGGQQQRVALARALIVQPRILLFDEPLCNLDSNLRKSMRTEILKIQRQTGITSIYVTHDEDEAFALSHRVVRMKKGEIESVQVLSPLTTSIQELSPLTVRNVG